MRLIIDFWVFLAILTGLLPSHTIRLFLYRRLFRMKIGKYSHIHWLARFNQPSGIEIGDHCIIGNDAFLDGRYIRKSVNKGIINYLMEYLNPSIHPLHIGNNVSIAGEVRIYTMEHDLDDPYFKEREGSVIIKDRVVVGTRVTILPGVTIGEGAVIASGAVVTKNVAPFTVVGGVPAKFIKNRNTDLKYQLDYGKYFQ